MANDEAKAPRFSRGQNMQQEKLKYLSLLIRARKYVRLAGSHAEALHDNPDDEYYMDGVQYEIMMETVQLIADIDQAIKEIESA